jgi:hypothetical protein
MPISANCRPGETKTGENTDALQRETGREPRASVGMKFCFERRLLLRQRRPPTILTRSLQAGFTAHGP